ncbi:MAG: flagellar export protein FliJ [Burkholderiales bacterium]|nr:flagellar export protein FliJ [Burkholderiales bacterium]
MKRPSAIELLIEMRRRERDRVAGICAQAQRDVDTATGTLRMLTQYRSDYESRAPKNSQGATDTLRVQVHERFVDKLGLAIGEQDNLVGNLSERSEQQQQALSDRQRRLKAMETLALRRETERLKRLESLEQKQTDEFATQAYARARREGNKP